MRLLLLFLSVALASPLQLHAGELQEVGRVNLVDVADQWEILVPGHDYSERSVLVRADLEDSCFENGEQALRWFLTWVALEEQNSILQAADLRGWSDRDGSCVVSLTESYAHPGGAGGAHVYRWNLVPTEVGKPLLPGGGGGGDDSYILEPIIVDGKVTGMVSFFCRLTGFCHGGPSGLALRAGESYPGELDIDGGVRLVIQIREEDSTTYRMVTHTTGTPLKYEPALVEYEIAARVTEVARLPLDPKALGEDAARQAVAVRAFVAKAAKASPGTESREILRCEPEREGGGLDALVRRLEYRSRLQQEPVNDDLSPGTADSPHRDGLTAGELHLPTSTAAGGWRAAARSCFTSRSRRSRTVSCPGLAIPASGLSSTVTNSDYGCVSLPYDACVLTAAAYRFLPTK